MSTSFSSDLPWPNPVPFLAEALASSAGRPERIGRYAIVGLLGEGGMGVVYRALQESPAREVALKVLHPGRGGAERARRFAREVEALGRLEHRGIARLYEAGDDLIGGARVPYFAMELVDGTSITRFAVERGLGTRERVELLAAVCGAVEYAHARGIVHRDLKPANVLVTAEGEPKVLDFGIARVAADDAVSATLQTEAGQILGTIAYMSPEQCLGDPAGVDEQSDVYALGAIGYELVTGRLPLDVRHKTLADAACLIRDRDPLPASAFHAECAGDLDAILGTALAKEKARRYGSAAALGADLARLLRDEPVLARTPTWRDSIRRLARRHRAAAVALAAVVVVLVTATIVSIRFALGEARQRRLADLRALQTTQVTRFQSEMLERIDVEAMGRGVAAYYRDQIGAALARNPVGEWPSRRPRSAAEVAAALRTFDDTVGATNGADVARHVLGSYVLGPAAKTLADQHANAPPLVRAQLHLAIGAAYRALGLFDDAVHHLREAYELRAAELGHDHIEVADALNGLAIAVQEGGDDAAAEPLFKEAVEISRRLRGDDDLMTLAALVNLAGTYDARIDPERAEPLYREALALARARYGNQHDIVAGTLGNLGVLLHEKGDDAGAEAAYREAISIRQSLPDDELGLAEAKTNLAVHLARLGRVDESELLLKDALALHERRLGRDHPHTFALLLHVSNTLGSAGKLEESEALQRRAVDLGRRLFGDDDPRVAQSLVGLAENRRRQGDLSGAEELLQDALRIFRARPDRASGGDADALAAIALLHHARHDYETAAALHRESIETLQSLVGPDHNRLVRSYSNLAATLRAGGDLPGAESAYREALRILREQPGSSHALGITTSGLGNVLHDQGEHAAAEPRFREAIAAFELHPELAEDRISLTQSSLATTLTELERFDEAEALLLSARAAMLEGRGRSYRAVKAMLAGLVALHERWNELEPNEGHAEQAEEWRARLARVVEGKADDGGDAP